MKHNNLLVKKRIEKGLFARRIAKELGYSRSTLYRKERGQTLKLKDVEKFAKYYKISKEEILKDYEVV